MNNALETLRPLIDKKSNISDPHEFQSIINVVFHDHEAGYYDSLHAEMWQSLPHQYELFAADILPHLAKKQLRLLDIGCGTGLATKMLLDTPINEFIEEIHLLDTSARMLKEAEKRSAKWGKKVKTIHGDINDLTGDYDLIVISSVLHHIPDLGAFLKQVDGLQDTAGVLFTIHDPAQEAIQSATYAKRCEQYHNHKQNHKCVLPLHTRIINKLKRLIKRADYIDAVNKTLLKKGVIKAPLTPEELWSVTDIHVEDLPYSANEGISIAHITNALYNYKLLSYRTYTFFGPLSSHLSEEYKIEEIKLGAEGDKFGRNFGSAWLKREN